MEYVSADVLADWFGISATRVRDLVRDGTIPKAGHGKYDLRACLTAYLAHLRHHAARAGRPPADSSPEARTAKERLTEAQARLAEAKADQAAGKLLDAAEVERTWTGIVRDVRAGLLAVPSRVGASLPHLTAHDVAMLDRELRAAMEALSDGR